ncbi:MAG: DUF2946 family protein [Rhizomicrobium sp.]
MITLCFGLQSIVTQTHIHTGAASITAGIVIAPPADSKGKSNPLDNDSTNCLFCQEMLYAGHFAMPGAPVLALPVQSVSYVPVFLALPLLVRALPLGWQGRAPPHA